MSAQPLSRTARPAPGVELAARRPPAEAPQRLGLALVVIAAAQLMIVLDATIVNVALPHMQRALHFSGSGLEWVVTAYSLTFGGLLLLGGRLGDVLGRRRVFIAGIAIFSLASFAGGFATAQWWLLMTRALQGAGAALASPAALALIATTFPEGTPRNRALGVYAAMSGGGGAIGLLLGGVLTTYVSWRWVLFVNVPIGIAVISLAPFVLARSVGERKRPDIPGAITSSAGLALLVYGLTHAAAGRDGVSHWGSPVTIGTLAAAVLLLASFVLIERRSPHAELPLHIVAPRARRGAYLMMLIFGTALFASFFFMTIYIQTVWGYSPVRTGLAWLPMPVTLVTVTILVSRVLVTRWGVRPLLMAGPLLTATGFAFMSRLTAQPDYWTHMLLPLLVIGTGFGLMFVPLTLTVMSGVARHETGVASGLLNTGQQIGGSIGLAAVGTIAWTGVASSIKSQMAALAAHGGAVAAGGSSAAGSAATASAAVRTAGAGLPGVPPGIADHALTAGFSTGLLVAACISAAGFFVAYFSTRTLRPKPETVGAEAPEGGEPAPFCDPALGPC